MALLSVKGGSSPTNDSRSLARSPGAWSVPRYVCAVLAVSTVPVVGTTLCGVRCPVCVFFFYTAAKGFGRISPLSGDYDLACMLVVTAVLYMRGHVQSAYITCTL